MASAPLVSVSGLLPLRIEGVVKRFGGLTAVNGVTLELKAGECLGLLGPNGAGKSTLIRSVVGRVIPDAGTVSVFGAPADSSGAREVLGWIPQELALYPKWCLDWASLTDRALEPVLHLSGGMKRRLNMAAGLIHRPKVILMDEPTVGVDPQSRNRIFEMIEMLHNEGASMLYTTHYMEEAERLCDRIAVIDHGRVIALGTKDELVQNAFASRSEVVVRFVNAGDGVEGWVKERAGVFEDGTARFTIEHANEVAVLLDSASRAGHELADISLRKPNLESVFLHLTGRELRD
ncbi:MAG: ABC transporter ATP-binding protein [Terriglobales bacterium]